MNDERYRLARLDEIEEITDGREPWRPVRHHLGVTAFGVNHWTGKAAGDRIINEHDEADEDEELYLVLSGRAVFELDGERRDAPAGTLVFVRPGVKRTAFAEEDGTSLLAIGAPPGKAYEAHGWELWAPVQPLYQAGDYEAAADLALELIGPHPEYPDAYYNLACVESLAGRREDAIAHLRTAIEGKAEFRDHARDDGDFDPIREHPGFRELVGA